MPGRFTVETVFKGTDNTSGVISSIEKRAKAMERGLHGPVGFADKGIEGIKKFGAVAAAAGVAGGFLFEHMIESGAQFEQSITNVGAVMGKTRPQIKALEDTALSLGVKTQFSASEVAGGMEVLARKGFDADEILAGIGGTLNAVAASGEGTDEVIQVVASSLRGFGLAAGQASHVADVLSFVSEKTGAHITELGSALATAAPTANALGVSIEDTAAAVGLLQKMGIDAATSGSSVATMLAKISHPSKQAAEQMTALGLKFQDAKGNMLPFRDVLGQFVKAGDKTTGNMKLMGFFAELVGLRGDKAALGLRRMANSGEFDKLTKGLETVDGQAQKVANIKLQTTEMSWKLLGSTVEVVEDKLFKLNGGALKDTVDTVNKWITANQDLMIADVQGYVQKITDGVHDLSTEIDTGLVILDFFDQGLEKAFKHSASIAVFGTVLEKVFGGKDGEGPGKKAYDLGYDIGYAVDKFVLFIGVVKLAEGGVWAFSNAAKIAKAAMWAWEAGVTAVKWATVALGGAELQTGELTLGFGAAMTEASVGAGELALAEEGVTAGMVDVEAAAVGAEAGIAGVGAAAATALVPLAAAAAVLATIFEAKKFMDENGGVEGVKGFLGVGGRRGGFEGVDDAMNAQARKRRADEDAAHPAAVTAAGTAYDSIGNPKAPGALGAFGSPAAQRPPGPYADGYVPPASSPPPQLIAPGAQSDAAAKTNQQLNDTLRQIVPQLSSALKGTLVIKIPKGATGDVAGAPGVSVQPSGSFD